LQAETSGGRAGVVLLATWKREIELAPALAAGLGDHRLECIPPPDMSGGQLLTRVHKWVDHHHQRLLETQPDPPYQLLGWSFGGVVAIDMARRLRSEGRDVSFVGLLDTTRPRIRPIRLRDAVPYHLHEAALLADTGARRAYLRREAQLRISRRTGALVRRVRPKGGTVGGRQGYQKPTAPLKRSIHRSYLNYEATPVDFPVALFNTGPSTDRCGGDPTLYWAPFLRGGYTLHAIDGDHHSLWEPANLDRLAHGLRIALDRAREDAREAKELRTASEASPPGRGV
jgi:thioesterase domain-containing protein